MSRTHLAARLFRALQMLPARTRDAYILHTLEVWPAHRIAEHMGMSEADVSRAIHKAIHALDKARDWIPPAEPAGPGARPAIRAHRITEATALQYARQAREAGDEATARHYEAMAAHARRKAQEAGE